ncbi:N-acetylmuramoyl-L-alanine amidase [Pelagibacteraceae bacterium]|nr:N-acetylmuramoyl-L-alanine amidase [Pelagibacteraceae bacterium]
MKILNLHSPNFNKKKRRSSQIKLIIIHYTGMQSERESIKRLCNSQSKVSSHYLISKSGKIFRMVNDYHIAWHAGKSCWKWYKNLNKNSIGIELVNKGHDFGYTNFKKKQISILIKLCKKLIRKYNIKRENIIGHSDIAPLRKIDPGEKFPWEYLSKKKIGIWHDFKVDFLKNQRKLKVNKKKDKKKFMQLLNKIGYCFNNNKKRSIFKTIKSFQRHYRKDLINGFLDRECLIIAKNLAKKQ